MSTSGSQTLASRSFVWPSAHFDFAPLRSHRTDVLSRARDEEKRKRTLNNSPQTLRDLSISLALEATEILEHFQWQDEVKDKEELAFELANVALYLLQLSSVKAILDKTEINKI